MSRCFPFPPPGYERQAKPDDGAKLIQKKHKEEKHKKEKKDVEKKERKERKDKERSSKKHKVKKDGERRDKEKDNNKDKEEKRAPEEKKTAYPLDQQNGTKLGPVSARVNHTQGSSFSLELEKGVWNDNGARNVQNDDKVYVSASGSKPTGKILDRSTGILVEGHKKFRDEREKSRILNGYRINCDAMRMENGFVCHNLEKEQQNAEERVWQVEKASERGTEQKDKSKHEKSDRRGDGHKNGDRERKSKSKDKKPKKEKAKEEKMEEVSSLVQSLENDDSSVYFTNDRGSNFSEESFAKNGIVGKRKEHLVNGFIRGSEIPLTKLPRPVSEVVENGIRVDASNGAVQSSEERDDAVRKLLLNNEVSSSNGVVQSSQGRGDAVQKIKLNNKGSSSNFVVANASALEKSQTAKNFTIKRQEGASNSHKASNAGDIGRKLGPCQIAMNSANVDHGILTNHTMNKFSLVLPIAETGINSQSCQPSSITSAERLGTNCKFRLENTESGIGDLLGHKKPSLKSLGDGSALAPRQLKDTDKSHVKPPHPDSKYLSQIFSVPKLDWSEVVEEEWLFTGEDHRSKKTKIDLERCEETKQVWAEVLQLESADVTALPYVIPY